MKLRTRFILTFLALSLIPLSILGWLNDRGSRSTLNATGDQMLLDKAHNGVQAIDNFLATHLDMVRVQSQLPDLGGLLDSNKDPVQHKDLEARTEAMLIALARADIRSIAAYKLLDRHGAVLIDTSNLDNGTNLAQADYFQVPMQTGLAYSSPVQFVPTRPGIPYLTLSSPVRNRDHKIVGVLAVQYHASVLQRIITESVASLGTNLVVALLDEHQIYLAHSSEPEILYSSAVALDPSTVKRLHVENRLPARSSGVPTKSLPGIENYLDNISTDLTFTLDGLRGTLAPLRLNPWHVGVFQSQEVLLAPANEGSRKALILGLIIAAVVSVMAVLAAHRFATPITRLTHTAEQVANGDLAAHADERTSNEIGILARTFNTMTYQLRQTMENLEQRVEERTLALREALLVQEQQGAALQEALAQQQELHGLVMHLSVPILPIQRQVLVVPLIGVFDEQRYANLGPHVLGYVERVHARKVIFDVTGMPVVDTQMAQILIQLAASARLLGTQTVLVGIRPEVAQTLIELRIEVGGLETWATLQQAIERAN